MIPEKKRQLLPRIGGGIYILPNLITTGNLFFGFFSIVKSMQQDFIWAATAIFVAAIFDILDGRVARLTKGVSDFGVQYDSLCDLVSFGLAPSFLMYQYSLENYGRIGWILCFIYLSCGALRLARFNVQSLVGKSSSDFNGLPIPVAACLIASIVLSREELRHYTHLSLWKIIQTLILSEQYSSYFFMVTAFGTAFLMVSNITYRSHKSISLTRIKPFHLLAVLVVVMGLVAYQPSIVGFLCFFFYTLMGPLDFVFGLKKLTNDDDIFHAQDDEEK